MPPFDRPFEVGDRIEVEGTWGSVVSVGILSTKVLDRDERLVVIPNNTLVQSKITNHARGGGDGVAEAELRRSRDGGLDTAVAEAGLRRNVNGAPTNQLITAVAEEFRA